MVYDYWKDSELKNALHEQQPEFIDNGPSSSQHLLMHGGDLTSNDQVPASEPYPIKKHPHPVHANQSESHAPGCSLVCKWNDGDGPCGQTASQAEMINHLSSSHLPRPGRARTIKCQCQWEGCNRTDHFCRDTILRHIRQIHLGINRRRQSSVSVRQPKPRRDSQPY
ncbi:hypothetical protein BDR04DRAFT_1109989 [Suillus decipiens]|nr:hypothetical protein BDR04DRAFT_1109989 [Suillus decipiens]